MFPLETRHLFLIGRQPPDQQSPSISAVSRTLCPEFWNLVLQGTFFFGTRNFLLPEGLERLGLIHYLLSLAPVKVPEGLLDILDDPLPARIALPVPLLLAPALLALAAWKVRRMEVGSGVE